MTAYLNRNLLCTLGLLALFISAEAQSAVIDFQSLESAGEGAGEFLSKYTEEGFTLTAVSSNFSYWQTEDVNYADSTALFGFSSNSPITLTGGTFTLTSIELSELFLGGGPSTVTFTRDGGHSQTFTLDGVFGFETFTFDSGFVGATSVSWVNGSFGHQFDNIVVAAVPIPTTFWLLISALGLTVRLFKKCPITR